ncbi:MAG: adenylosuccinate synthetase [Chloroflexota bacterium]
MDRPLPADPLMQVTGAVRPNTIAIEGGAFGDEGKGKIVDELCTRMTRDYGTTLVYRWNGGSNAGHTVVVGDKKIALHQLPSGTLTPGATVILGKGMVLHPGDLVAEIDDVVKVLGDVLPSTLYIDQMAVLALDTHRAYEATLQDWESGGKGSTGRGISPAYADVLYRHPMRMRDLRATNWRELLSQHYDLYTAFLHGLGVSLDTCVVPTLNQGNTQVGTKTAFLLRLEEQRQLLLPYIDDVYPFLHEAWYETQIPVIFEGAQAVGLDMRFGVYPDITASDPTFSGILHSTEGIVHPEYIAVRAGAIKATYTSSVGARRLPTAMDDPLAHRIREDAHEYGATTKRPRDIAYIDVPCLSFYAQASSMTHLVMTHLDIAYADVPIKVCTHYTDSTGKIVPYRPDQVYLDSIQPHYLDLPSWRGEAVQGITTLDKLPAEAKQYIAFLTQSLAVAPIIGTTGPQRDAVISWLPV